MKKNPVPKPAPLVSAKFDLKILATLALVILAVLLAYYILSVPPAGDGAIEYDKGELGNSTVFASAIQSSNKVYIVMDVRNASESQRKNILQCGTDFAGSNGLVGKEIVTFAVEDDKCTSLNGTIKTKDCISESLTGVGIYIRAGGPTAFFVNKMIVGMGEGYTFKACSITAKKKDASIEEVGTGTNQSNNSAGPVS